MKSALLFFLCLTLCSCLNEGTDVGNPGFNNMIGDAGRPTIRLTITTCNLLSDCEGETIDNCSTDVLKQTNIDTELGLAADDFPDLEAINKAEFDGLITANTDSLQACDDDIKALSCSDSSVQGAYHSLASNPYEGVAAMLPTSCQGVF